MADTKKIEDIPVMFISVFGNPANVAKEAFNRLEKIVPLKGNQFYATYQSRTNEYRVCVKFKKGLEAESLGLQTGIIPGGLYAFETLQGKYGDIIRRIPQTFENLEKEYARDRGRPSIEYYKRFNEFILYLPIL